MVRKVLWPASVQKQLEKAYKHILKDSPQNATKVKKDILDSTHKLALHPEIHPKDKYRETNDGSFRAYEIHHYRIAYQIKNKEIIIVRVRHTSKEPKKY